MEKSKLKISLEKDQSQKGIWQFSSYLAPLPQEFRLSLEEGNTLLEAFEENLFFKREDQNPTGSLKDRGMAYLVSWAWSKGEKNLVLSSSGNAAIAAAEYCRLAGLNLHVFVSPKIPPQKLKKLKSLPVEIHQSLRPVSEAVKFSRANKFFNLRPSTAEFGSEGFETIAFELAQAEDFIEEIFAPVSSAVSLRGVARGFQKLGFLPRLHLCQPASCSPLASVFDQDYQEEKETPAQALVAKSTPLKEEILGLVKESQGHGWVIETQEVKEAQAILEKNKIKTSAEGALALAAVYKARKKDLSLGKTVCLLTGKKYG